MTLRKLALAAEILGAYGRVRWTVRRHRDLRSALALLRAPTAVSGSRRSNGYAEGVRLGHAVTRVLDSLPADSRCLTTSLVLCRLLSRRGVTSSVVIGVRPGSSFGAHAWVELDGRPVLPPNETEFARLVEL